jgi:hypothetical protein
MGLTAWMLAATSVEAQTFLEGLVRGREGEPIPGASLRVLPEDSPNAVVYGTTGRDGRFRLRFTPASGLRYLLVGAALGRRPDTLRFGPLAMSGDSLSVAFVLTLEPVSSTLQEVVVGSRETPFRRKGDTLEYEAARFRTMETNKLESLLRRMDGFDVAADGRIRYNGKEIDRILVEGEDMAEKDYRLISRNLGAGLIDKVQVLHRFSVDRLMREVENSGRIGINLTIDSSHRGRVTGTVEAGVGPGRREWLDNSAIRVGEHLKSMAFLRYNETGDGSNTDMEYHYGDGGGSDGSEAQGGIPMPVATGHVPLPPLEASYVRDNRDLGSHVMANASLGKGTRFKAMVGAERSRIQNAAWSSELYLTPDGSRWTIDRQVRSRSRIRTLSGRVGLDYDRGGNHTGRWRFVLHGGNASDAFSDLASGAVNDTLVEQLLSIRNGQALHGEHLSKLASGRVLKAAFSFNRDHVSQSFQTQTQRLESVFPNDGKRSRFVQELEAARTKGESSLVLHGRSKATDWRLGMRGAFEGLSYESHGWVHALDGTGLRPLEPSESGLGTLRMEGFAAMEGRLSERWAVAASMHAGYAFSYHALDGRDKDQGFPLHSLNASLKRSLSILRFQTLEVASARLLPSSEYFHPSALLSGEATMRWPANDFAPFSRQSLRFRHVSNSLAKGRESMLTLSYSRSEGAYALCIERTPSFLIGFPRAMPASGLLDLQVRQQKYLMRIRTKAGASVGVAYMHERLVYNSTPVLHHLARLQARIHAVTVFQGNLDFETSLQAEFVTDRMLPEAAPAIGSHQWNLQGHVKCRIRWSEKFFSAVMDRFYRLGPSRFIHAVDLHAGLNLSPRWRASLVGHNLMNIGRLSQRLPSLGNLSERNTAIVGRYLQVRVSFDF